MRTAVSPSSPRTRVSHHTAHCRAIEPSCVALGCSVAANGEREEARHAAHPTGESTEQERPRCLSVQSGTSLASRDRCHRRSTIRRGATPLCDELAAERRSTGAGEGLRGAGDACGCRQMHSLVMVMMVVTVIERFCAQLPPLASLTRAGVNACNLTILWRSLVSI